MFSVAPTPPVPELLEEVCVLLLDRGASGPAREIWDGLEELEPSHPATHLLGGLLDFADGRYAEAEARYRKVLAARPDEDNVRAFLAEALLAQRRWREAESLLAELQRKSGELSQQDTSGETSGDAGGNTGAARFGAALMEGLRSGLFHRAPAQLPSQTPFQGAG